MDLTNYTEKNRKAWNEVAPFHNKAKNIQYPAIDFSHTLSDIFSGILKNNMSILEFEEYSQFSLIAEKE